MHCGTNCLLLLQLALTRAVLHHMALLATVITDIGAHSELPSMELATRVSLDTFGLLVGLTVVVMPVVLPFLNLPLEIHLLIVVLLVRVLGLLVRVLTQSGACLRLGLRLS